jgi:hypothetical protein
MGEIWLIPEMSSGILSTVLIQNAWICLFVLGFELRAFCSTA